MRSWGWGPYGGITALRRRNQRSERPTPLYPSMWGHCKKAVQANSCKLTRKFSPEPNHAGTWSQTSQPSELWEINVYCLNHLLHFVIASELRKWLFIFFNYASERPFAEPYLPQRQVQPLFPALDPDGRLFAFLLFICTQTKGFPTSISP